MSNNRDNLIGVFQTIYRWRKAIRNMCLLALVASIAGSLLMKNYYQATTIFYPTSPQLANPELMFGNTGNFAEYYGSDRDLDRMAEICNSNELMDYIIWKFGLYQRFSLDSTTRDGRFKMREIFKAVYVANKNKNDAIEINVEDTDPATAANMANVARDKVNAIGQRLTKEAQSKLLSAFEDNINRKKKELAILSDSLRRVQATYGIYDLTTQGEQLAEQLTLAEAGIARNRAKLEVLEKNPSIPRDTIEYIRAELRASERQRELLTSAPGTSGNLTVRRFNEGMPQVAVLTDLHFQARKQLSFDLERYNQIKSAFQADIPALFIVQHAEIPVNKSRPKRSIIVIASVLAAFLFTALAALLADAYKDVNWRSVRED